METTPIITEAVVASVNGGTMPPVHHTGDPVECQHCGETYKFPGVLMHERTCPLNPNRESPKQRRRSCPVCKQKVPAGKRYEKHVRAHNEPRPRKEATTSRRRPGPRPADAIVEMQTSHAVDGALVALIQLVWPAGIPTDDANSVQQLLDWVRTTEQMLRQQAGV